MNCVDSVEVIEDCGSQENRRRLWRTAEDFEDTPAIGIPLRS